VHSKHSLWTLDNLKWGCIVTINVIGHQSPSSLHGLHDRVTSWLDGQSPRKFRSHCFDSKSAAAQAEQKYRMIALKDARSCSVSLSTRSDWLIDAWENDHSISTSATWVFGISRVNQHLLYRANSFRSLIQSSYVCDYFCHESLNDSGNRLDVRLKEDRNENTHFSLRINASSRASFILAFNFLCHGRWLGPPVSDPRRILTSSMLENNHFPLREETLINPLGNSPSKVVFFKTKTNPLSWYINVKGSACSSARVLFSW